MLEILGLLYARMVWPKQLSVDHEPNKEKKIIESKGGFGSNLPGNNT